MDPNLKYPLGYLLGPPSGQAPSHYRPVRFPVPLLTNRNTMLGLAEDDREAIAVVGEAIDPESPGLGHDAMAQLLLAHRQDRQAVIDRLVGRFVVIAATRAGEATVQTDAIGLRTVYFSRAGTHVVAGSHAKLVAEAAAPGAAVAGRMPFKWGYPGIDTPYADVFRLPANVSLSLPDGRLQRFFPLQAIPATTIEETWSYAFDRAARVIEGLTRRKPVVVSLTGGLDSRTTLAASRASWERLSFFTYLATGEMRKKHEIDLHVAEDLARALGLRHQEIDLAVTERDAQLLAVLVENTFARHIHPLACAYHGRFGPQRTIHVRTNLLELARSNLYTKRGHLPGYERGPNAAETMASFYLLAGGASVKQKDHVLPAFRRYVGETNFDQALPFASAWDLFFVEHRMGAWQAGVVAESDIAFDTVIAFNSREIVKRIMGVPQEVRSKSSHLVTRLAELLPEVRHIPINPESYTPATA